MSGSAAQSDRVPASVRPLTPLADAPRPVRGAVHYLLPAAAQAKLRGDGRVETVRRVHPAARVHAVRVLRLRRRVAHRRRRLRQQPAARMPLDGDRTDAAAGARQLRRRDHAVGDVSGSVAVRLRGGDRRPHGAATKHRSAHPRVSATCRRQGRGDHRRLHCHVRARARRSDEGPTLLRALERPPGFRSGVSRPAGRVRHDLPGGRRSHHLPRRTIVRRRRVASHRQTLRRGERTQSRCRHGAGGDARQSHAAAARRGRVVRRDPQAAGSPRDHDHGPLHQQGPVGDGHRASAASQQQHALSRVRADRRRVARAVLPHHAPRARSLEPASHQHVDRAGRARLQVLGRLALHADAPAVVRVDAGASARARRGRQPPAMQARLPEGVVGHVLAGGLFIFH